MKRFEDWILSEDMNQGVLVNVVAQLENLLVTSGYEFGAETQQKLRQIIHAVKKVIGT